MPGTAIQVINQLINVMHFLLLARVILSWVRINGVIPNLVYTLTEPFLKPIRQLLYRFIPHHSPMARIDFSPLVLMLLLQVVGGLLFRILINI